MVDLISLYVKTIKQGEWIADNWGQCNTRCGHGMQQRKVVCTQILANETVNFVEDKYCLPITRPKEIQSCVSSHFCPEWLIGPWSECSELCGEGFRNRTVTCSSSASNETKETEDCEYLPYKPSRYRYS